MLGVLELFAFAVSHWISDDIYYRAPTSAELTAAHTYHNNLDEVSRALGWVPEPSTVDVRGARISPRGDKLGPPCVSVYGDSFTFGAEVPNEAAWTDELSDQLGCRVANFGVIGFGTDQAVLRYASNDEDRARVVVLMHMVENIVRNVNQDRTMLYGAGIELKPRFTVDRGALRLIPRPDVRPEHLQAFTSDPGSFLGAENFLPNSGPLAKRRLQFPYLWHVPGLFRYHRLTQGVRNMLIGGPPWYAPLYTSTHPSQALLITSKIVARFAQLARARGQRPVVFMLPSAREFDLHRESGTWLHAPLIDAVRGEGVDVHNLGPGLLKMAEPGMEPASAICDYFCTKPRIRGGHYTRAGNALLARVAHTILRPRLSSLPAGRAD